MPDTTIQIKIYTERPAEFWTAMGPHFASRDRRREMLSLHDAPGVVWFLAYAMDGETPAGFASLDVDSRQVGHLRNLYVLPAFREQGVASRLMDARLLYLRQLGILTAQTTRRVSKEISFAENHGFAVVKTEGGFHILRAALEPLKEETRSPAQQAAFEAGYEAASKRMLTSKKRPQKLRAPQAEYKKWDDLRLWEHFCAGWTARLKAQMEANRTWDGEAACKAEEAAGV